MLLCNPASNVLCFRNEITEITAKCVFICLQRPITNWPSRPKCSSTYSYFLRYLPTWAVYFPSHTKSLETSYPIHHAPDPVGTFRRSVFSPFPVRFSDKTSPRQSNPKRTEPFRRELCSSVLSFTWQNWRSRLSRNNCGDLFTLKTTRADYLSEFNGLCLLIRQPGPAFQQLFGSNNSFWKYIRTQCKLRRHPAFAYRFSSCT